MIIMGKSIVKYGLIQRLFSFSFMSVSVAMHDFILSLKPAAKETMLPSLIARRWAGRQTLVCCLVHRGSTGVFPFAPGFGKLFGTQGPPSSGSSLNLLSLRFLFIRVVIMVYLFVLGDSLTC